MLAKLTVISAAKFISPSSNSEERLKQVSMDNLRASTVADDT